MAGKLYLVGTPIGNLGDISPRAAETLAGADFVAAEDTRVTRKLLSHLGIHKELVSYYEENRKGSGERILQRLLAGETCALVSDAGMPVVSDPGRDLTALCAENGIEVLAVPGPCAAVTALALSGLPAGRFTFEGFLSANKNQRRRQLESLRTESRTMIFYEAPHKLTAALRDMAEILGDRQVALCREMTKLHEETVRTTLSRALALTEQQEPRGEYVLVVAGVPETDAAPALTPEEAAELALSLREKEGLPLKEAVRRISLDTGVPKNALYDAALRLSKAE